MTFASAMPSTFIIANWELMILTLTNVTILTSISQNGIPSRVAIFHHRQHIVCLSYSSHGMRGHSPLMNDLFWERRKFHLSFSGRDMSWNVWNRPSGSSIVDMGIWSNIIKSPSPKWYMPFLNMIIYIDTHRSDISPYSYLVTELDLITIFEVITLFREVSIGYLQLVRIANRGRLLLRTPGPVIFWTCICFNSFYICHVYGPFEFRTSIGTSLLLHIIIYLY